MNQCLNMKEKLTYSKDIKVTLVSNVVSTPFGSYAFVKIQKEIWKIQNSDGTLWQPDFKSRQDAEKEYDRANRAYVGALAGAPHKIVRIKGKNDSKKA